MEKLNNTNIPDWLMNKWQEIADLLANLIDIPAALIMKTEDEYMEVLISSKTKNNPYHIGDREKRHGLYCEAVIKSQKKLLVPNALTDKFWDKNPDIKLGMISYLGFPINYPNNTPFGTICVLDSKENMYNATYKQLLIKFKNIIENDLFQLYTFDIKTEELSKKIYEQYRELEETNRKLHQSNNELKSIEKELRGTNEELIKQTEKSSTILNAVIDGVYLCSSNYEIEYLNPVMINTVGYNAIGEKCYKAIHNLEKPCEWCYFDKLKKSKDKIIIEIERNKKNFLITSVLLEQNSKLTVYHDISQIKKAEKALISSEKRFKQLSNLTFEGILIHDKGIAIDLNLSLASIFGYSRDELLGQNVIPLLIPAKYHNLISENIIKNHALPYDVEGIRKDGSVFPLELEARNIESDDKSKIIRVTAIRDITQRKKAEQKLLKQNQEYASLNEEYKTQNIELIIAKEKAEESDKLKSAFLANMSHEIRTPMNGLLGFAELLKEPNITGEEQQKYIQVIEKSGARMLNIINDIISISKIESGLMEVNISESDINELIEYIYSFFNPETKSKGIQFLIKNYLPLSKAIIKTDKEKLFAILTNLVKNAIKYTEKGSIEIGCDKKGKHLEFYVKDTGIGIDSNRQEAIFERFIQADIKDIMAREGAGLGLSISRVYVEMLGGKLWVESEKGLGSIFYFTIPYTTELKETDGITNSTTDDVMEVQVENLKILIVEDDETSDLLINIMLTEIGKEILNARSGIEAIELCRNNPDMDLILMDVKMPVMGGHEATQQIRQFNKDVIIIAQTAYGLTGDREKALEAGCNDYIAKPINKDELLSLVQKYFKK